MENKQMESECKTAHGKPIGYYKDADGKPLESFKYQFIAPQYPEGEAGIAELVAAKDELTLDEQRKVRNSEKVANARAKQLQTELDARKVIKPTPENDPQVLLKDIFDKLMLSKRYNTEEARKLAATVSGIEWAE